MKFVAATCFSCWAKVRTPLNSPLVGANPYLSSGIATASGSRSRCRCVMEVLKTVLTVISGLTGFSTDFSTCATLYEPIVTTNRGTNSRQILLMESSSEKNQFRLQNRNFNGY